MRDQIEAVMFRVAEETLEKLAFVFSMPEEEREDLSLDATVEASVSFAGPFSGTLVMRVSSDGLSELAANMLGVEEDETTQEDRLDALKETINVICGNLLPAIAGERAVFNIQAPRIALENETQYGGPDQAPVATVRLGIDDGQCDLHLFLEGGIPPDVILTESK